MTVALPEVLEAAVPYLNQPQQGVDPFDPVYRARLLEWGLAQIDHEIRPDPIFRPLDYFRRAAARREWRRVVREQGVALRTISAAGPAAIAQEQIAQIAWSFAEVRRRDEALWNQRLHIDTLDQTTRITTDAQIRLARVMTDEEIRKAEALAQINTRYALPTSLPDDPLAIASGFERKIAEIRIDPALSQDEKHQLTLYWTAAMQAALAGPGGSRRG